MLFVKINLKGHEDCTDLVPDVLLGICGDRWFILPLGQKQDLEEFLFNSGQVAALIAEIHGACLPRLLTCIADQIMGFLARKEVIIPLKVFLLACQNEWAKVQHGNS